jgi:hypothetical protein
MAAISPMSLEPAPMASRSASSAGAEPPRASSGPRNADVMKPSGDCVVLARTIRPAATPTANAPERVAWLGSRLIAQRPF